MTLFFATDQYYPRRPLPPAPYLFEEPRAATAALEAAVRACPQPTYFGKYAFATGAQRHELHRHLDSPFLTYREAIWLELWRSQLDSTTAEKVLTQLRLIISHREATGIAPMPYKGSCFFPVRSMPPQL